MNLTDFYDYILTDVRGVTLPLALLEIRNAAIEYFEKTRLIRYEMPAITLVAGTASYALTPEASRRIVDIEEAKLDGASFLTPKEPGELDAKYGVAWRTTLTNTPEHFLSVVDRSTIRPVPTPSAAGSLVVTVSQTLTRAATDCPDWILQRDVDGIADGAKARLFAMSDKPWSDPGAAGYRQSRFDEAIGQANGSRARGHTRARLRVAASNRVPG